jgi:hypothetical protein
MSGKRKAIKAGMSAIEKEALASTTAAQNRARVKALQIEEEAKKKVKALEKRREREKRAIANEEKRRAAFQKKGKEIDRKNLDEAGIEGDYDPNNPQHRKLYAKWKQKQRKAKEQEFEANLKSNRQISSHKKVMQEPVTPSSEQGMFFGGKGETTKRKKGGKVITYRMTGGQVVASSYD